MKQNKIIILAIIVIIAILAVMIANMGLTNNITTTDGNNSTASSIIDSNLEEHAFDSYFTMNIPKNTSFEKTNDTSNGDITLYVNYKDPSEKINVIYAESKGGNEKLKQAYEDMAKDNANITLKTLNNATILHLNDENIIGENDYHDIAVIGDDEKYVLLQCNNESLMNSMAKSLKFN